LFHTRTVSNTPGANRTRRTTCKHTGFEPRSQIVRIEASDASMFVSLEALAYCQPGSLRASMDIFVRLEACGRASAIAGPDAAAPANQASTASSSSISMNGNQALWNV